MSFYLSNTDCLFCIEQLQPAGLHDVLGPVFAGCLACYGVCPTCQGDGLFPADETCIGCFTDQLAARGFAAVRCPTCLGICDLIPINPKEANPHAHRN